MTSVAQFSSLLVGALAIASGCTSSSPLTPVELPTSLNIDSINVAGSAQVWTPDNPVALRVACSPSAPVLVGIAPQPVLNASTNTYSVQNFELTVPGNCGTNVSCGWMKLRAAPALGNAIEIESATSPITVKGLSGVGSVTFTLELHDSYDQAFRSSEGNLFGDQVIVDFTENSDCPAEPSDGDAGV